MSTLTETEIETKIDKLTDKPYALIVHNDDVNSFDHVIECLITICGHSFEQASQIAFIIHHRGKCDAKRGSKDILLSMKEQLQNNHLTCSIEKAI